MGSDLNERPIRRRLLVGFAAVLSLLGLVAAMAPYSATEVNRQLALGYEAKRGVTALAEAQAALWQLRWNAAQFIFEPGTIDVVAATDPALFAEIEHDLDAFATTAGAEGQ